MRRGNYTKRFLLDGKKAWLLVALVVPAACPVAAAAGTKAERGRRYDSTVSKEYAEARGLFERFWIPGERSSAGGDGLGPLYNEQSCVGCHHLGGTGGAGDNEKNVVILTASARPAGVDKGVNVFKGELEELHPGFKNRTSVVLHARAVSAEDRERLQEIRSVSTVQTRDSLIGLERSRRSTPALFGVGLIDGISDQTLLDAEKRRFKDFPEIKGRVSRLSDGRLGRFGWKGQTSSLREFVMAACANELGLEVPGRHQTSLLPDAKFDPKALKPDMDQEQCDRLVKFVANLPAPVFKPVGTAEYGRQLFDRIGCAVCHAPKLGRVEGLYSDLLLHDLGDRFISAGGYGGPSRLVDRAEKSEGPKTSGEAGPREWRSTPLWGVAASAPYLHDGRATTLNEAIRLHGGEAAATSDRYTRLGFYERQALLAFLHSLAAPAQPRHPATKRPGSVRPLRVAVKPGKLTTPEPVRGCGCGFM